jgi:hypothetical protein
MRLIAWGWACALPAAISDEPGPTRKADDMTAPALSVAC